ncbi:hypothetical protein [[Phormidium] sp. ETS-05]|uniref:hypothetical protein n=1 Tax=[Phormidium] sp. ETS-05 TaxID=222819 RepID=UPI0018EED187|nr:hypothetical protein [[Phormidium] sp. ETS-05]
MATNIGELPVREDVIVTIAGTVAAIREDEFLLQDSTGQIWVEPQSGSGNGLNLNIGDQVTVVGDRDDLEDFDAVSITLTNAAVNPQVISPNSPPTQSTISPGMTPTTNVSINGVQNIGGLPVREDVIVTIAGQVAAVREDEFLLQDSTGQIWVEPQAGSWTGLNLNIGDQVTVVGDRDDLEDFDAVSITLTNAAVNPQVISPNSPPTQSTISPGMTPTTNVSINGVQNIGGLPVREDVIVTIAGKWLLFGKMNFYCKIVRDKFGWNPRRAVGLG